MNFEITGKLIEIYPVTSISDKFRKREFVIEKTETKNNFDFTDYVKFQLVQDKCNLLDILQKGETIKVFFNLRGRKWEKAGTISYFTNLEAWKIEKLSAAQNNPENGNPQATDVSLPGTADFSEPAGDFDDLPF